ncbi:carbohydrate ABC transporter permease [Krasilnikovia sp. M28-CT-15]|uniref:carbohydrate ABC transporter permease n=1 Tax=Krasilnikovia sp. M28-CT-15 TaxID=3373540 RepID=UPI00387604F5
MTATLTRERAPAVPQAAKKTTKRRHGYVYVSLVVAGVATVMPFVWMLLGSVKPEGEILADPGGWLPHSPTLDNYREWFTTLRIGTFFRNSVIVAVVTVLGNLLFCSMVGYALAKLEFRGKRILFALVMVTLMVPGVVTFVPLFVVVAKLHLINTYAGLILPFLTSPLGVFLMRQFMRGIPDELIEAARIDGAGEFRIFARIVLPLSGPPLATLGILTFLASWNNFLWPLVVAQNQDRYTLPVALSLYSTGEQATNYGLLLAGSVMVITPILAAFIALQRWFVQGVATAGLK